MKIVFFCFFVFITTQSVLTDASDVVVYDSAGNKLLRGIPYYILPLLRGYGGGLTLSRNIKNACPMNVTLEPFETNLGVPFIFNPIVLDEEIIRASYPTSIEADVTNPCSRSSMWKVSLAAAAGADGDDEDKRVTSNNKSNKKKDDDDDDAAAAPLQIVTADGEFNKPDSCFQIVEDGMMPGVRSYHILHCPFKCGLSITTLACYNVGVVSDADGERYLARTDAIFPVIFTNSMSKSSKPAELSTISLPQNDDQ